MTQSSDAAAGLAERRLLAELARRRMLATAITRRHLGSAKPEGALPSNGERDSARPPAVWRSESHWQAIQRFWWRRRAPHRAMLRRRAVTTGGSAVWRYVGLPFHAPRAIEIAEVAQPPASSDGAHEETLREQSSTVTEIEPPIVVVEERPRSSVLQRTVSGVWRRMVTALAPVTPPPLHARHARPRDRAPVAREVPAIAQPDTAAQPDAPALLDSTAQRDRTVHENPLPQERGSAEPMMPEPAMGLDPDVQDVTRRVVHEVARREPQDREPPSQEAASSTESSSASSARIEGANASTRNAERGTRNAVDDPTSWSSSDAVAPLAAVLTQRFSTPSGVLQSTPGGASPGRVFWWPIGGEVALQHHRQASGETFATSGTVASGSLTELADQTKTVTVLTPVPSTIRRRIERAAAPGVLGPVARVHAAAIGPSVRPRRLVAALQRAARFAEATSADTGRWRVRAAPLSPEPTALAVVDTPADVPRALAGQVVPPAPGVLQTARTLPSDADLRAAQPDSSAPSDSAASHETIAPSDMAAQPWLAFPPRSTTDVQGGGPSETTADARPTATTSPIQYVRGVVRRLLRQRTPSASVTGDAAPSATAPSPAAAERSSVEPTPVEQPARLTPVDAIVDAMPPGGPSETTPAHAASSSGAAAPPAPSPRLPDAFDGRDTPVAAADENWPRPTMEIPSGRRGPLSRLGAVVERLIGGGRSPIAEAGPSASRGSLANRDALPITAEAPSESDRTAHEQPPGGPPVEKPADEDDAGGLRQSAPMPMSRQTAPTGVPHQTAPRAMTRLAEAAEVAVSGAAEAPRRGEPRPFTSGGLPVIGALVERLARRGTRPTRVPPAPPLPERPWEAGDSELVEVIRRLPAPMAAAILAAGVLGDIEARTTATHIEMPVGARAAEPREAESATDFVHAPATQFHRPADPFHAPPTHFHATAEPSHAPAAPLDVRAMPAAPETEARPDVWSPMGLQHAPSTAYTTTTAAASSAASAGADGGAAMSMAGLAAAPVDRETPMPPSLGTPPAAPPSSLGPPEHDGRQIQSPDLDRIAEQILDKLRWRLAAERERLMG